MKPWVTGNLLSSEVAKRSLRHTNCCLNALSTSRTTNRRLWPTPKRVLHLSAASSKASSPSQTSGSPAARKPTQRIIPPQRKQPAAKLPTSQAAGGKDATPSENVLQERILWHRRMAFGGAAFLALSVGLYLSLVVTSCLIAPAPSCTCGQPSTEGVGGQPLRPATRPSQASGAASPGEGDCVDGVRQTAAAFDASQDLPEYLIGINGLRKAIAERARGHVLEVAVGTGRNLAYYDWNEVAAAEDDPGREARETRRVRDALTQSRRAARNGDAEITVDLEKARRPGALEGEIVSFTGVDISGDMMSVARRRIRDAVPGLQRVMRRRRAEPIPDGYGPFVDILDSRVRLYVADAQQPLLEPPDLGAVDGRSTRATKYDTIIQTFGLCSVSDPVKLVSNMAWMVQPETGRIVLLEHGRGWVNWVNGLLDDYAERHFHRYGCWWNRDIEGIITAAVQQTPGLEVIRFDRPLWFQAGTTYLVELRMRQSSNAEDSKK